MTHQVIFTPADLIEIFKSVCYLITLVAAVVGIIVAAVSKMRAPNRKQDETLKNHEERLIVIEKKLASDSEHFERIEGGIRVYQRGILALINHSIDGNNLGELQRCRDDLKTVIYHDTDRGR